MNQSQVQTIQSDMKSDTLIKGVSNQILLAIALLLTLLGVVAIVSTNKARNQAAKSQKIVSRKMASSDKARLRKLTRIAYGFAPFKSRRAKEDAKNEIERIEAKYRT